MLTAPPVTPNIARRQLTMSDQLTLDAPPSPAPAPVAKRPQPKRYRVSLGDKTAMVAASDRRDAWARFCDAIKAWPSPKAANIVIECLDGDDEAPQPADNSAELAEENAKLKAELAELKALLGDKPE